jgi:hypothetical protein
MIFYSFNKARIHCTWPVHCTVRIRVVWQWVNIVLRRFCLTIQHLLINTYNWSCMTMGEHSSYRKLVLYSAGHSNSTNFIFKKSILIFVWKAQKWSFWKSKSQKNCPNLILVPMAWKLCQSTPLISWFWSQPLIGPKKSVRGSSGRRNHMIHWPAGIHENRAEAECSAAVVSRGIWVWEVWESVWACGPTIYIYNDTLKACKGRKGHLPSQRNKALPEQDFYVLRCGCHIFPLLLWTIPTLLNT